MKAWYQRTGAPIHPAYALPQLLAFYRNHDTNQHLCKKVYRWQTISSICLHRWTGGGGGHNSIQMPISYSEASWTGMMNFRTCTWDEDVLDFMRSCSDIESISGDAGSFDGIGPMPPLMDFDAVYANHDLSAAVLQTVSNPQNMTADELLRDGIPPYGADGSKNSYWDRWPELRGRFVLDEHATTSEMGLPGGVKNKEWGMAANVAIKMHGEETSHHCRLFLGIGDGAAANIGSKCGCNVYFISSSSFTSSSPSAAMSLVGRQRIAVTIGTSAAARVCLPLSVKAFPPLYNSLGAISSDCAKYSEKINMMSDVSGGKGDDIEVPPGLFCYRVDRKRILLGGALTDGGSVVEWARSLLNLQSKESFDDCLKKVSEMYHHEYSSSASTSPSNVTPSRKVTMIPFLSGERSTGFRGGARACLSGMTRETTSTHFMYACLEGVILRMGAILKLINDVCSLQSRHSVKSCCRESENKEGHYQSFVSSLLSAPVDDEDVAGNDDSSHQRILVASGSALERNCLWRQMLADCTGLDVVVDGDSSEGTSRGVAILMAISLHQSQKPEHFHNYVGFTETEVGNDLVRSTVLRASKEEEPLIVAHKAVPNSLMKVKWMCASLEQETLIDAVSTTWNVE